jgi:hypothetical protein
VSLTAPASGGTVSGNSVAVTASASDTGGIAGVQFKLDGSNLGQEDTVAPYSVTWNTTLLPDGTYTLTAVARDQAGNSATAPARTVTIRNTVVTDTTPPTITITEPGNGQTVSGTALAFSAQASDNTGVSGVLFSVNGTPVGTEDTTAPYGVLVNTTQYGNGAYTLTARARDQAGNTATSSVLVTISNTTPSPDTTPPSIPQNLVGGASRGSITLSWNLSVDDTGVVGYRVERCTGSSCTNFVEIGVSTGNGYTDTEIKDSTTYTYRVRALDAAQNLSGYSNTASADTPRRTSGGGGGSKKKKNSTTIYQSGTLTPDSTTNLLLNAQQSTYSFSSSGGSFSYGPFTQFLTRGSTGTQVRMLQELLRDKGLLTQDSVTGYFGEKTLGAVKQYQCMKGILCSGTPESNGYGTVGLRTRTALNAERTGGVTLPTTPVPPTTPVVPTTPGTGGAITAFLYRGVNHPQVATLQSFLMKQGYLPQDTPTTFFGQLTDGALKRFQCEKLSVCSGTPDTTGYGATGPRTRALVR